MKLVKMSLAAAVLLGASAFAIDNIKVSGDAKVYYGTSNAGDADLFDKDHGALANDPANNGGSYADTALRLGVTGDLLKGVSFGVTGYAVSTLGLENNLVGNTWTSAHTGGVEDNAWVSELWLATTMGKTTAKVGRMELDTPLAFSESWSIAKNTFDAAVLINQDLPDTTLVGAWVGKGNGINHLSPLELHVNTSSVGIDYMANEAAFTTFGDQGAYAAGLVNNSFKPLTAQAWYYNVSNVADAYWLQADIDCSLVKGVKIGAQYANIDPKGNIDLGALGLSSVTLNDLDDSKAYAVKLGYEGIEGLKLQVAYSDVDKDGALKIANTATNNLKYAQSKLYTEAWWNYGYVGAANAESLTLTAEYASSFAKFGAYYTDVNDANMLVATGDTEADMTEVTLTASKSFGPLDATLAYVSTDADDQNNGKRYDSVQAYLTLNF